MDPVDELANSFRETARYLREHAASEQAACVWEKAAQRVEEALEGTNREPLTLDQAELESGYTRGHLRRLIREDRIQNSGTESNPRILRRDLPKKPGHGVREALGPKLFSRVQAVRAMDGEP